MQQKSSTIDQHTGAGFRDHRVDVSRPQPQLENAVIRMPDHDEVSDEHVVLDGEPFICIRNVNRMPAFLMNVVSDSDLWLFVGSNTGLTAGRRDPDHAIFPYLTADKILHQPMAGGAFSLLEVDGVLWEPWSPSTPAAAVTRNLYKHATGTSVRFEETHRELRMRFCWTLESSEKFGLVRSCRLENLGDSGRNVRMLDGWHQLLPPGVSQDAYSRYSYLASAYMRHEALVDCGLGIYTLNSGISDRPDPSESLRISVAWTLGHLDPVMLLSDRQVDAFRRGEEVTAEEEVRGEFGAHLIASRIEIPAGDSHDWFVVADGGLDHAAAIRLRALLRDPVALRLSLMEDLKAGVRDLTKRISGAGAQQQTADTAASVHHFANVLFNCMRGGTFHDGCHFSRIDLNLYLDARNTAVLKRHSAWVDGLPDRGTLESLAAGAAATGDPQLVRLVREYLPLSFSRRHGDPSRPWNRFEIRTKDRDGEPLLGYSGNWRDIFQNWESLAYSYPECFKSMIAVFLNASTADGYNPYRITREGIDWEVLEPKDPWSHIGYWGDHQIIYLLRLLEGHENFWPGKLASSLASRVYAYANVPYEIHGFDDLVDAPRHSISFNENLHEELLERARVLGGDGRLLSGEDGEVALVSLCEKLLVPVLVKLQNLIPGGGIWLNTQRPEWNDANNALAGWGLSVVTVCYVRRYLNFLLSLFDGSAVEALEFSSPVVVLLRDLAKILPEAAGPVDDASRWRIAGALGRAGETHRSEVYQRKAFASTRVKLAEIRDFVGMAMRTVDVTIAANRRGDGMFHSYNVLDLAGGKAAVRNLDVMMEGQVAVLSSGNLGAPDALRLLDTMRHGSLYRKDQNSYLLYPDRKIAPYLSRNLLPAGWENRAPVLARLLESGNRSLISVDDDGGARFNADFANSGDLQAQLDLLEKDPAWKDAVAAGRSAVLDLWEDVFHHSAFTGRSGAMFGFEGLGSIYWHMVAKLLLAVQEIHLTEAMIDPWSVQSVKLATAYDSIRNGLGFTKDAKTYGAFPTDPYSHSPGHRGAQQPGMTGQVKEEILTRKGELGVRIRRGRIHFEPALLKRSEFFTTPHVFHHVGIDGESAAWSLPQRTLAFSLFQVPVSYVLSDHSSITVERANGVVDTFEGSEMPVRESVELFLRNGLIQRVSVTIPESRLRRL